MKEKVYIVALAIFTGVFATLGVMKLTKEPVIQPVVQYVQPQEKTLGFASQGTFNLVDTTTPDTTTTLSTNAQIVLARNPNRIYALVQNDSDTDVYVHLRNFDDNVAASTTVTRNNGIRLVAGGGALEILPEAMYIGDIWVASTTVSGKNIIVTER